MIATILTTVVISSVTVGLVLLLRRRRIVKLTEKIPGPAAVAVFGNSLQFPTYPGAFYLYMEALCLTYKDPGFCRIWVGPNLTLLIYRADLLEVLFNSSKHITKAFIYKMVLPWLRTGLLTSSGEKWHARRKMLTPTFHFKILEDFLEVMNEQVNVLTDIFDSKVGQEAFDVQAYIAHCTLDIICETAMGCHTNAQRVGQQSDYVKAIHGISEEIIDRFRQPWLWLDALFWRTASGKRFAKILKVLHDFTRKVILERSAEFDRQWKKIQAGEKGSEESGEKPIKIGKRMAFLDMLLWSAKKDPSLKFEGIQEEVDTFMFEGHDTTAATTVWMLYFIGKYPEVQEKLHEEVDQIFGENVTRPMAMGDLNHFKYMECVLKETMRLYPTVPLFGREISEDCKIGGHFVPKGTSALIMTFPLHRDPTYFPDPETFDPDRWITDNPTEKHPFCYVPFSAGFRNCIGQKFAVMEEKVIISSILRKFNVTCVEPDDIERSGLLILRPAKGLRIKLTRRHA